MTGTLTLKWYTVNGVFQHFSKEARSKLAAGQLSDRHLRWSMLADSVHLKWCAVFTAVPSASISGIAITLSLISLKQSSFDKHKTPASSVKGLLIYRLVLSTTNLETWRAELWRCQQCVLIQLALQSNLYDMMICVWQDPKVHVYIHTDISWG